MIGDAPYIAKTERWGYERPPKKIGVCRECIDDIYEGIRYAEIDGVLYCECCLQEMPLDKLLGMFGIELREAANEPERTPLLECRR